MRPTPQYITAAGIASNVVRFPWDEWNCRRYYGSVEETMLARLERLTNKANTSLAIATGEWICERFSTVEPDPTPRAYLEAAWAGAIHPAYCKYTETYDDDWRGPVRAPLALTITLVNDALFGLTYDPRVAVRVCWLYNLTRHVLPDLRAFEAWFEACIQRMEQFHDRSVDSQGEEDLFADAPSRGSPVPREAFDPALVYSPVAAPAFLDAFLRGLRPELNPFLRSPGELAGEEGIPKPYQYTPSPRVW